MPRGDAGRTGISPGGKRSRICGSRNDIPRRGKGIIYSTYPREATDCGTLIPGSADRQRGWSYDG